MKPYPKNIYQTAALIQKYKDAGLVITDDQKVETALNEIGFYRLRGYSFHLYDNATKKYIPSLEMFSSWIHAVVVLRNICAHNSRIYNRSLTTKPKLLSVDQQNPAPRYCGLYHFLLAMKYLRPSDDEWNDFITSFDALLNKYQRDIDLGKLHLPSDWRNHV